MNYHCKTIQWQAAHPHASCSKGSWTSTPPQLKVHSYGHTDNCTSDNCTSAAFHSCSRKSQSATEGMYLQFENDAVIDKVCVLKFKVEVNVEGYRSDVMDHNILIGH